MKDFFFPLLHAALAANFLLATGWGLAAHPQGKDKIKGAARMSAGAGFVTILTVVLSGPVDFYMLQLWWPPFSRPVIFILIAYLAAKAAAACKMAPVPDALALFAAAVALVVREDEMLFMEGAGYAAGAALGAGLVFLLGASVMERLDFSPAFRDFRAVPVFFGVLAIFSLIFRAFRAI